MNYSYSINKYKIIFVGDSSVGKTSILNSFMKKNYTPKTTVGTEFTETHIDKYNLTLQIWDCAGQERFRALTKLYYRYSHICIFVFDLSNPQSLESLQNYWINTVQNNADKNIQFILVGNKNDLSININYSIVWDLCKKYNMKYIEVSATQNSNISNIFNIACLTIISQPTNHLENNNHLLQQQNTVNLITPITIPEKIYNIYSNC